MRTLQVALAKRIHEKPVYIIFSSYFSYLSILQIKRNCEYSSETVKDSTSRHVIDFVCLNF